jgi:hypothetical protein
MNILILIIYSNSEIYNQMLEIQRLYINKNNNNIETYFITYDEQQLEDVKISNDIIYVKGKETYINILHKTIQSIDFLYNKLNKKYDFVVRTNMSTIINLDNLYNYIGMLPKNNVYTGGKIETLTWQLAPYAISAEKQSNRNDFYGLKYIQGDSIIISSDIIQNLLSIKDSIEYDIVDDVKLGLLIRENFSDVYNNIHNICLPKLSHNCFTDDSIFLYNKTNNRLLDVNNMRNIIQKFTNIIYPNFNKTIYITYKNIEPLVSIKNEWLILNPMYNVELYDNLKCKEFLNKYFGKKFVDIFEYILDGPIKSDFFRCCIIYIFGGVYVDADIKPLIPIDEYIEADTDFATCISYNYTKTNLYKFNPHFIVSKKNNVFLHNVIKKYELMYDNNTPYSYWDWSICRFLNVDFEWDIKKVLDDGKYIYNNKKYQFLVECIVSNDSCYNFTNIFDDNGEHKPKLSGEVVCKYNNSIVLTNFTNKNKLKELIYTNVNIPLVVSYENNFFNTINAQTFHKTLKTLNWDFIFIEEGKKFEAFKSKITGYFEFLKKVPEEKIVILSDSRDVFCLRSPLTFMNYIDSFTDIDKKIIISAEMFLNGHTDWPDEIIDKTLKKDPDYFCQGIHMKKYWDYYNKTNDLPLRKYLNSGLIIGKRKNLIKALQWIIDNNYTDDQLGFSNYSNENPELVMLDYNAELLHTSGFGVSGGMYDPKQKNDSPTFSELMGLSSYFLHIPGMSNSKGQKYIYEMISSLLNSNVIKQGDFTKLYNFELNSNPLKYDYIQKNY